MWNHQNAWKIFVSTGVSGQGNCNRHCLRIAASCKFEGIRALCREVNYLWAYFEIWHFSILINGNLLIIRNVPPQGCQDVPKKYEAVFSFAWEPSQEHCRILYMGDLREISVVKDPWNPTKHIGKLLKTRREEIKVLSNSLAVHDCKSLISFHDYKSLTSFLIRVLTVY